MLLPGCSLSVGFAGRADTVLKELRASRLAEREGVLMCIMGCT